jgi:hypothetical protein
MNLQRAQVHQILVKQDLRVQRSQREAQISGTNQDQALIIGIAPIDVRNLEAALIGEIKAEKV